MHFVLLNQFYPPEVLPTGVMLEAVAEALVARGHQVTVLCGKTGTESSVVSCQSSVTEKKEWGAHAPPRVPPGAPPGDATLESALLENSPAASPAVQVVRLWAPGWGKRKLALGKILSYTAYYWGVAAWLLRHRWPAPGHSRADVIVALTSPPYLSLLARFGAWWHGGQHAHWVMDLYPDVMIAHGMLNQDSLGHRLLGALARLGMGGPRCRRVITLGPDMAERVQAWMPPEQTAVHVPLWGTAGESPSPEAVASLRHERGWEPDDTVFLYSGNMGLGHRFTEVLQAAPKLHAALPGQRMHLAYFGGGKRQEEIRSEIARMQGGPAGANFPGPQENSGGASPTPAPSTFNVQCSTFNVNTLKISPAAAASALTADFTPPAAGRVCPPTDDSLQPSTNNQEPGTLPPPPSASLHPYVPHELLAAHLASGDVHLASLEPAWDGMMVPSKLQGIFSAGRPVLFTGSRTCSIGRWILESGAGWVCAPGDIEAHVAALQEALDPEERARRGAAARVFATQHFDRGTNVERICGWLEGT